MTYNSGKVILKSVGIGSNNRIESYCKKDASILPNRIDNLRRLKLKKMNLEKET